MKQFWLIFAVSFAGAAVALLLYRNFIQVPQEQRIAAEVDRHVSERVEELRQAGRETAEEMARSIQAAQRERERARAEAEVDRTRRLIEQGLVRAGSFKLAMAESYFSLLKWPDSIDGIGLPPTAGAAEGAVSGIVVEPEGAIRIRYSPELGDGVSIVLKPKVSADMGRVDWACEATGEVAEEALPEECR